MGKGFLSETEGESLRSYTSVSPKIYHEDHRDNNPGRPVVYSVSDSLITSRTVK